jgi:hypothetical protein
MAGVHRTGVMPGLVPGISLRDAPRLPGGDGRNIDERSDAVRRTAMPGHDEERLRIARRLGR